MPWPLFRRRANPITHLNGVSNVCKARHIRELDVTCRPRSFRSRWRHRCSRAGRSFLLCSPRPARVHISHPCLHVQAKPLQPQKARNAGEPGRERESGIGSLCITCCAWPVQRHACLRRSLWRTVSGAHCPLADLHFCPLADVRACLTALGRPVSCETLHQAADHLTVWPARLHHQQAAMLLHPWLATRPALDEIRRCD